MMDKDKKGYIRFLFNQNKQTISQISREVNLSRFFSNFIIKFTYQKLKILKYISGEYLWKRKKCTR